MIKTEENYKYDVIVIGAGHSGCEAALASARGNIKTLLISINMDSIAHMPFSNTVGGFGRDQLIREIDILGAEISRNIDKNYIQIQTLKRPETTGTGTLRAIVDKRRYFLSMKRVLENQGNLYLRQGLVVGIKEEKEKYNLYTSDGIVYHCDSIIICTGTFLGAKIFWGEHMIEAGRQGEICSKEFLRSLKKLGIRFGRLKNYAAPLIDRKTINVSNLEKQSLRKNPQLFSHKSNYKVRDQLNSYIAYIDRNFSGWVLKNIGENTTITGSSKRKASQECYSIEEKVLNSERIEGKKVFIQPIGRDTSETYLEGLETAVSEKIQVKMIRKIKGLEEARITRPGYGVEYNYLIPFQLNSSLESKDFKGVFFAGQINGTAGYEESAAQGIIAGLNASRKLKNLKSIIIERKDGYIGILINDIAVKGVSGIYRLKASINEYNS